MTFIWQLIGAMFGVAGGVILLTVAGIVFYTTIVGIRSALDEYGKKRTKKTKKK